MVCAHVQTSNLACNYKKNFVTHMDTLFHPEIDECSEGTDNCTQICTNTNGSFICGCNTGFQLDDDGVRCNGMQKKYIRIDI